MTGKRQSQKKLKLNYFHCTPTHISLFTRIMWLPFFFSRKKINGLDVMSILDISQGPFVITKLIGVELSFQKKNIYIYNKNMC